ELFELRQSDATTDVELSAIDAELAESVDAIETQHGSRREPSLVAPHAKVGRALHDHTLRIRGFELDRVAERDRLEERPNAHRLALERSELAKHLRRRIQVFDRRLLLNFQRRFDDRLISGATTQISCQRSAYVPRPEARG